MSLTRLSTRSLEKVWGSTRLEPLYPNSSSRIGEVWAEGAEDLPLLIKFLFTTDKLSVQVHPGDEYARLHHNSAGKTEMWYVVAAESGAKIAAGFREPITKQRLRDAAISGEIMDLLEWYDARPGDVFLLPAGTVHAIGEGLTLCEIQQHSDITYRLYDYGRPRELHLEHSLNVSSLEPINPRREGTISCPCFTTEVVEVSGSAAVDFPAQFVIVTRGSVELNGQLLTAGEVWRWKDDGPLRFSGQATLLLTRV